MVAREKRPQSVQFKQDSVNFSNVVSMFESTPENIELPVPAFHKDLSFQEYMSNPMIVEQKNSRNGSNAALRKGLREQNLTYTTPLEQKVSFIRQRIQFNKDPAAMSDSIQRLATATIGAYEHPRPPTPIKKRSSKLLNSDVHPPVRVQRKENSDTALIKFQGLQHMPVIRDRDYARMKKAL